MMRFSVLPLLTKDELDLERRYLRIGATRAKENIPFSQVAWVIVLVKDNLCAGYFYYALSPNLKQGLAQFLTVKNEQGGTSLLQFRCDRLASCDG